MRTGSVQNLREVTFTPEVRPAQGLVLHGDVRMDASSANVFEKEGGFTDTQLTVGVNVLVIF